MPKRPQPRELSRTLTIIGFTTFDIININLILSVTLFPVLCRAFNFFFFFGRYMAVHGELNYCESCFRFNAYHTTLFVCNILKILSLYIYYKIIILQHCDIFPSFLLPFSVCVYFLFLLISQNAVKFIVFRSWSHSLKKKKNCLSGCNLRISVAARQTQFSLQRSERFEPFQVVQCDLCKAHHFRICEHCKTEFQSHVCFGAVSICCNRTISQTKHFPRIKIIILFGAVSVG